MKKYVAPQLIGKEIRTANMGTCGMFAACGPLTRDLR